MSFSNNPRLLRKERRRRKTLQMVEKDGRVTITLLPRRFRLSAVLFVRI